MTIQYDAHLELDGLADALTARGLSPGGKVQKFIDSKVILLCDPKVPFRTGVLKRSPMIASVIGQGLVIYAAPYARYLYYGEVYGPNIPIFEAGELAGFWSPPGQKKHPTGRKLAYSGAPERGAFWFERMKAEHGEEIIRGAAALAGGRATP